MATSTSQRKSTMMSKFGGYADTGPESPKPQYGTSKISLPSHRFCEETPPAGPEGQVVIRCHDPFKVLLLGSTGNGKSTTGNWLLGVKDVFQESDEMDPCTKEVQGKQNKTEFRYGKTETNVYVVRSTLQVWDTPGLNEADENEELQNTQRIISFLSKMNEVTMIFICVKYDQKCDSQFQETFQYYRRLLQKVFDSENWGIIITKMSLNVFKKYPADNYIAQKKAEFSKILGVPVPHLYFYNPYIDKFKEHNEDTYNVLLKTIFMLPNLSISGIRFPLPPQFERRREEVVQACNSNISTLSRALSENSHEIEEQIKLIEGYQNYLLDNCRRMNELHKRLGELQKTTVHQGPTECGDDWLYLSVDNTKKITIPLQHMEFDRCTENWNCSELTHNQRGNELTVTIKIDRINLWSHKGKKWFWNTTIYYDGKKINKAQIEEIVASINDKNQALKEGKTRLETDVDSIHTKNETYKGYFQQYNEFFYLLEKLGKTTFDPTEIKQAFDILAMILKAEGNISTLDYKNCSDFDEFKTFKIDGKIHQRLQHEQQLAKVQRDTSHLSGKIDTKSYLEDAE